MRASDKAYAALRDDIIEWRLPPVPSSPKWSSPNGSASRAPRCARPSAGSPRKG